LEEPTNKLVVLNNCNVIVVLYDVRQREPNTALHPIVTLVELDGIVELKTTKAVSCVGAAEYVVV
jgi:hypothetical protein